jgi:hypothetical protein
LDEVEEVEREYELRRNEKRRWRGGSELFVD